MSARGLIVHQGSLSTLETALSDATAAITAQIDDLLAQVESLTPGWDESSESHLAHLEHPADLAGGDVGGEVGQVAAQDGGDVVGQHGQGGVGHQQHPLGPAGGGLGVDEPVAAATGLEREVPPPHRVGEQVLHQFGMGHVNSSGRSSAGTVPPPSPPPGLRFGGSEASVANSTA